MVTFAQAQERAERWVNGDVPAYLQREVRVREFDLGFVAWAEDREDGPTGDGGRVRLVIARDSGETTLWPGLPVGEVIRRYEEEYGSVDEPEPATADEAPPRRVDLNQTSFLLSPPQWLQDAADAIGIPDRRSGAPEAPGAPVPGAGVDVPSAAVSAGATPASPERRAGADARSDGASSEVTPASSERRVGTDDQSDVASDAASAAEASSGPWAGADVSSDAASAPEAPSDSEPASSPEPWAAADVSSSEASPEPWAGADVGEVDDDRSVGLPATVLAPALSGSDADDTPPPGIRPDAKTELMPQGSALPRTTIAPALTDPAAAAAAPPADPTAPPAGRYVRTQLVSQLDEASLVAGALGAPGAAMPPVPSATPGAPGQPAPAPGAPGAQAAGAPAFPGAPGQPPGPGAPGVPGQPGVPGAPQAPGQPGVHAPGAPGQPGPHAPGAPGAPGAPAFPGAPGQPSAPGAPQAPGVPGAQAPGAPQPPSAPGAPQGPGGVHAAATMLAGPGTPGMPGAPGAPAAPRPPQAPGAPPQAPSAPQGPGGGVHAAATMLAGPGTPGMPGAPGTPQAPQAPQGPAPAYGYPPAAPTGVPTVGPGYMAVLRYRAQDGSEQQVIRRSAPGTPHPEWQILHELRSMNVPPQQVLELHTELESCDLPGGYCARMIRETWPQVRISHTAAYGRDHATRQQGVRHLVEHQGELHQVADGPARPAPNRVPLPPPGSIQPAPPVGPDVIGRELAEGFGPQGIFRFDQRAVSRQGVPEVVAQTLVWAGLPVDFGPFFWGQAQPGRPVPTLAELAAERGVRAASDAGSYLVMGSDYGRQLCVQYGTAHIVAVPVEAGPDGHPVPPQFVNTSLPQFIRSLALLGKMWRWRYGLTPEQAGRWTVDFQSQLAALDPAALSSPENWWAVLLEQMWDGLF
ncbi:SUKH-4 family immunity protein [Streptomyces sp. NPDC021096]|uniref:SUKH-4 family immunity protein n=1 Tax=Streptomyces sp. NPDC021096 TaxID=3154792 RepID=UPI0033F27E82